MTQTTYALSGYLHVYSEDDVEPNSCIFCKITWIQDVPSNMKSRSRKWDIWQSDVYCITGPVQTSREPRDLWPLADRHWNIYRAVRLIPLYWIPRHPFHPSSSPINPFQHRQLSVHRLYEHLLYLKFVYHVRTLTRGNELATLPLAIMRWKQRVNTWHLILLSTHNNYMCLKVCYSWPTVSFLI